MVSDEFLHQILCMIVEKNILLTNQMEDMSIMCLDIICFSVYDDINFENKVSFAIKPLSYKTK